VDTDKPLETTETLYRFKGKVAAGKATKLTVKEEVIQGEQIAILPADLGQLQFYAKQGEIPAAVREALTKAAGMKSGMVDTDRQINERTARLQQVTAEQQRIRENLKTVSQQTEYYTRLMKKLNDQETQIEAVQKEVEDLRKKLDGQRKELEQYLTDLNVA
jgi:chromosome segregation ATPase